ncbi:MAG: polyphosphate kinase 2 family protein [Gammaproteobacteria bacterium]|nr:polyphosphate kinase 2 family protein [Gammaproteobacteria bacterium]
MNRYQVKSGKRVKLSDWDPNSTDAAGSGKDEGTARLAELQNELGELQELLYAEHQHRLLVILQGMDTSGKDGTIRHVFKGVDPQGVRVMSFKTPSARERDHDYLWRVHQHTPGKGEIVIFNRSHYEDVVVTRVMGLVTRTVWERRYAHINDFERMLSEEGTTILKFFLHIDQDTQWERLRMRLDDPRKRWKFSPDDIKARERWPKYVEAYEDVLAKTNCECAPWYIIPANKKWYRNLAVSSVIVETLRALKMKYPAPENLPQ